ncbi:MAG TPA: PHB depolymerase family esterase [Ilumatobacteraceae bacterium]|nr:PHB depolymerase family esterase [Ilumatobacteraceae bacterium]HRB03750.1 PHB depolymerase family esterase [Ilumatobacteraceae bacterium]
MRRLIALLLAAAVVASCSSGNTTDTTSAIATVVPDNTAPDTTVATTTDATTTDAATTDPATTVAPSPQTTGAAGADPLADRPFDVFVPTSYDAATPMPLVVLLHGYGASGIIQNLYFGLQPLAESRGFLYVHPDGTINQVGKQFWNATDACCGFGSTVDDVGYLTALVENVQSNYNVDPKRIFFVGHSNGGFMSYRMACDRSDMVAAIASLAGATWENNATCDPSQPVSVLQIHGTADETIGFEGGTLLGNDHPGARETVADWSSNNGCSDTTADLPTALDLDAAIPGDESTATEYTGCPVGGAVELWVIPDAPHVPPLSASFGADIIDFLFAHPKP